MRPNCLTISLTMFWLTEDGRFSNILKKTCWPWPIPKLKVSWCWTENQLKALLSKKSYSFFFVFFVFLWCVVSKLAKIYLCFHYYCVFVFDKLQSLKREICPAVYARTHIYTYSQTHLHKQIHKHTHTHTPLSQTELVLALYFFATFYV